MDDLTTLSQADEAALQVEVVPLDLVQVATDAAERLRAQFEHHGVALPTDSMTDAVLAARCDRHRLTQIVTNLLGDALAHTPGGGTVTLQAGSDGATNWIEVIDTGSGIPPAELQRIFEQFYRDPDTGAAPDPRAGRWICLTIARSLA